MNKASIVPFTNYRERYVTLLNALGIECDMDTVSGIDHAHAVGQAATMRNIVEEMPETCTGMLRSFLGSAKASGYTSTIRDMFDSASTKAEGMPLEERSGSLSKLFSAPVADPSVEPIPGFGDVFEIMSDTDVSNSRPKASDLTDRLLDLINSNSGKAVLALAEAARKLPAGEWWLDDNRPWRLMLNLNAVAEDEELHPENGSFAVMSLFDHDDGRRGAMGDGQPAHLKAILRLLEAASAFHAPLKNEAVPVVTLLAGGKE